MDDLRAILFFAHGVQVMTQGLPIAGIGLIIILGLGCQSPNKLEPLPLPTQLPPAEYTAPQAGSVSPMTPTSATRPTVSQPVSYPTVQSLEPSATDYSNVSGASIKVPYQQPEMPHNPANFSAALPVKQPMTYDIDPPQPPSADHVGEMVSDGALILPNMLPKTEISIPEIGPN